MRYNEIQPGNIDRRHTRRLSIFLLVAAILHLLVLIISPHKHTIVTTPVGDLSLSFASSEANSDSTNPVQERKNTKDESSDNHKPHKDTKLSSRTNSHSRLSNAVNRAEKSADQRSSETKENARSVQKQLLGKIKSRLSNYLVYPPVARQRGWQGEVRLTLDVNEVGQLENIRIAKSSGHPLLDLSAKRALNNVGREALVKDWQGHGYTHMIIPVKYQLNSQ